MAWMTTYDDIIKRDCINCGIGDRIPKFGTKEYAKTFGNRTVPHMANYAKIMKKTTKKCHCGGGGKRCKCHEAIEQGVISPVFSAPSDDPLRRQFRHQMAAASRSTTTVAGGTHTRFADDDFDGSGVVEDGFRQEYGMTMDEYMASIGHGNYGQRFEFADDDSGDEGDSERSSEKSGEIPQSPVDAIPQYIHHPSPASRGQSSRSPLTETVLRILGVHTTPPPPGLA